jgi:hypothetical protein
MAVKKWLGEVGKTGKWNTAANWEGSAVPGATSEVELVEAHNNNLEINVTTGKCKQIVVAAGYTAKISAPNTSVISIGTTTGSGTALKLVSGVVKAGGGAEGLEGEWKFVSSSGVVEKITTAGNELPAFVKFEGSGGKWKLEDATAINNKLTVTIGTLETNGQTVTAQIFEVQGTSVVKLGASTLTLSATWLAPATATVEAGTSTIELTGAGANFKGGGLSYSTVLLKNQGSKVEESNTFSTLKVNTAHTVKESKGTLVSGSTTLTVTEGTVPAAREEVRGTAIPAGTTIVKVISEVGKTFEMSAAASETVVVAENITAYMRGLELEKSSTQTVTSLTTNGKSGEPARLVSTEKGKAAKVKSASVIETDWMIIRDITFEGAGEWWAGANSIDGGGNTNIKFAAKSGVTQVAAKIVLNLATLAKPAQTHAIVAKSTVTLGAKAQPSMLQQVASRVRVTLASQASSSVLHQLATRINITTGAKTKASTLQQIAAKVAVTLRATASATAGGVSRLLRPFMVWFEDDE